MLLEKLCQKRGSIWRMRDNSETTINDSPTNSPCPSSSVSHLALFPPPFRMMTTKILISHAVEIVEESLKDHESH
jgi:hypothetical protein